MFGELNTSRTGPRMQILVSGDGLVGAAQAKPAAPTAVQEPTAAPAASVPTMDGTSVLKAIEDLIAKGQEAKKDLAFCEQANLAPARALRVRRKSKQLEEQAMLLMGGNLEAVFRQFDLDGNGTLERDELKAAFEAAGRPVTDDVLDHSIAALDTTGDGLINLEEFKALAWKVAMPS